MKRLVWSLAATIVAFPCGAQTLPLTDASAFYEAFLDGEAPANTALRGSQPRVVGATIVGLRLAGPRKPFNPTGIHVELGPDNNPPSGEILCVRALSRDGRYFARGRYKLAGAPANPLLDFRTNFRDRLQAYSDSDLAILATGAKNCEDQKGIQQYVIGYGAKENASELVVQIRAGDARVRAQLGFNNAPLGNVVVCDRLTDGPAVGFTAECHIPLPDTLAAGLYQLSLGETAASGQVSVKTTAVRLAGR